MMRWDAARRPVWLSLYPVANSREYEVFESGSFGIPETNQGNSLWGGRQLLIRTAWCPLAKRRASCASAVSSGAGSQAEVAMKWYNGW